MPQEFSTDNDKGKPDWGFPLLDNLMRGDYWRIWLMS